MANTGTTNVTWFRFSRAGEADVIGAVQGCGGVIASSRTAALARIANAQRHAERGDQLGLYEPQPGHIRVYVGYCAAGNGDAIDVSLVDCTFEVVAVPGDHRTVSERPEWGDA